MVTTARSRPFGGSHGLWDRLSSIARLNCKYGCTTNWSNPHQMDWQNLREPKLRNAFSIFNKDGWGPPAWQTLSVFGAPDYHVSNAGMTCGCQVLRTMFITYHESSQFTFTESLRRHPAVTHLVQRLWPCQACLCAFHIHSDHAF